MSKFSQNLIYFFQIPHQKNFQVWANSNNFLLNKIFVQILTLFCIRPYANIIPHLYDKTELCFGELYLSFVGKIQSIRWLARLSNKNKRSFLVSLFYYGLVFWKRAFKSHLKFRFNHTFYLVEEEFFRIRHFILDYDGGFWSEILKTHI